MTVQFSGGEPTISPIFLDAVRYARTVGYFSVQAATNGIRFAQEPAFAQQAREAGLRIAYLQFDGVSEQANAHRKVANLFDVKLRAIENLYAAGIDVCLVVTIVNTVNDRPGRADRQVRAAELRQDQLRVVSACLVHRPRRGDLGRRASRQALHALAPRGRHEAADWSDRAAARLVPALRLERALRCHRPAAGTGRRLGHAEVRLPSGLRRGYGFHGQQENQGVGADLGVHQRRSRAAGCEGDRRFGARPVADDDADGA